MHCDTATMTTQCHGNMSIYWKNTLHGATEIIVLMVLSVSSGQRYGNFLLSGWARNRTFRFNRCRNFGLHDHPVPLPSCNYPCIQQRFTWFLPLSPWNGILDDDLSSSVPRPKIYVEENIPETWAPEEVRQLLSVIDRSNAIGKRDYAMLLLAILLGMRAGDICALKFKIWTGTRNWSPIHSKNAKGQYTASAPCNWRWIA